MTNIGTIEIEETGETLIFTDGMINNTQSKSDQYQKLFKIGGNLIVAAGDAETVRNTIYGLTKQQFKGTTKELAIAIYEKIKPIPLKEGKNTGSTFLIAGPNGQKPQATEQVLYQGQIYGGVKDNEIIEISGSGRSHTEVYKRGLQKSGRIVNPRTLEDGLALMYKLGKEGAADMAVNDKFQWGLTGEKQTTRIYHPDVLLNSAEELATYLNELTGIIIEQLSYEKRYEAEPTKSTIALKQIIATAYYNMIEDMENYNSLQSLHIGAADENAAGIIDDETFFTVRDDRIQAAKKVNDVVSIFRNPSIEAIVEYNNKRTQERQVKEEGFIKMYHEQQRSK